jgi:hypothetical protein
MGKYKFQCMPFEEYTALPKAHAGGNLEPEITNHVPRSSILLVAFSSEIYLRTYLLTELSPSWGAANCAATQELPSISRNPKVHHRDHKSPPLVPILSQIDPAHTILSL